MCDCIKKINDSMQKQGINGKISQGISVNFAKNTATLTNPRIELEKVDVKKRGRLPGLYASYCPFCGQKYEEE